MENPFRLTGAAQGASRWGRAPGALAPWRNPVRVTLKTIRLADFLKQKFDEADLLLTWGLACHLCFAAFEEFAAGQPQGRRQGEDRHREDWG